MARKPAAAQGTEREQRELECVLTPAERVTRSDEMKSAELEIEKLKGERTTITREINQLATTRNTLAHVLEANKEIRMTACTWTPDYRANLTVCTRDDTGAAVEQRPLTSDQKQVGLELVPGGDDDDGPPSPRRGRSHSHADPAAV